MAKEAAHKLPLLRCCGSTDDLPIWQFLGSWQVCCQRVSFVYMKNIQNKIKPHRSFPRVVRQWFSSLMKRQHCNHVAEFETIIQLLHGIEDSIEIVAREIARWARSDE